MKKKSVLENNQEGGGAFSWEGEELARKQTGDNPTVGNGSREQQMLLSRNSA